LYNDNLTITCYGHAILHAADLIQLWSTAYYNTFSLYLINGNASSIFHLQKFSCVVYALISPPQRTMKSMAGAILKIISIFGYLPLTTIIGLSCLNFVSFLDWTGSRRRAMRPSVSTWRRMRVGWRHASLRRAISQRGRLEGWQMAMVMEMVAAAKNGVAGNARRSRGIFYGRDHNAA
jgi:hypothetical protein